MKRTAGLAGAIGFVGGFVSDVLQPIAPFARFLFYGALGVFVILFLLGAMARHTRSWALPFSVVSLFLALCCGGILLLQDRAQAAEKRGFIANQSGTATTRLASNLLWDRDLRVEKLHAFLEANPDDAAAHYLLSRDFSAARLGRQSLDDKKREKKLLERFVALDEAGKLVPRMIDQELVAEWREDARNRLAALADATAAIENPLVVTWMHTSSGWMGSVQIAENAREILWKKPGTDRFISTGTSSARNIATGQFQPNMSVSLPNNTPPQDIEFKYVNLAGQTMGPYRTAFDPSAAGLENSKRILQLTENSWVAFRDWDGKVLLYFSHLLTHRGSISAIRYGLNTDTPNQTFDFPSHDQPGTAPISSDVTIYTAVPDDTAYVTVRVEFKDGTTAGPNRFDR